MAMNKIIDNLRKILSIGNSDYNEIQLNHLTTAKENVVNEKYTKLGSESPSIKRKRYSGMLPAVNVIASINHGLDETKITDIQALFHYDANIPGGNGRYCANSGDINSNTVWVYNATIGIKHLQSDMVGKPYTVIIEYEE
jgi:hypothetical protein